LEHAIDSERQPESDCVFRCGDFDRDSLVLAGSEVISRPNRLSAKLFTFDRPSVATAEELFDEFTGTLGPLNPFIDSGRRERVAAWWFTEGNRMVKVRSATRKSVQRQSARRAMRASMLSGGLVMWNEGDPFYDERPDMVRISYDFTKFEEGMRIELDCPVDEDASLVESLALAIAVWGCRVATGWEGPDTMVHPGVPNWQVLYQVMDAWVLDPRALGATWLLGLRPGVWESLDAPAELDNEPVVMAVPTASGIATLVRIAPRPGDLTDHDVEAWNNALRPLMPDVVFDQLQMATLLRQTATEMRARRQRDSSGESAPE
jgi:hypothetical protein